MNFTGRLRAAGKEHGRLCVGIDPHDQLLADWELPRSVDGLRRFSEACVEAFAGHVALVKPQVAFYEAYGSQGFAVLEETIGALREGGTLVLADAKRGDIGSTMAGYAHAWLDDESPLCSDAVTVSSFLGFGSLGPVLDKAALTGRGVFALAATSNPEARGLQGHANEAGRTISQQIVDEAGIWNAAHGGLCGVVVGATLDTPPDLRHLGGPVLLPGVGAQGGSAEDVARLTEGVEELSFAAVSRSILAAGPDPGALRAAAIAQAEPFRDA